jgi:hypothetical protein
MCCLERTHFWSTVRDPLYPRFAQGVDGCLNPPEFGDMGSAAVAGSD